ncbi:MAG: L-aspartate oxidase [Bacteroidetes bacterium]|nr:L-aspartate oxidase [Bacteroidota bacterium]
MNKEDFSYDIIILGGGAAGLGVALEMPGHARLAVFSKHKLDQGATNWAQGGIATVLGDADSFESHITDTIKAGAGLSDPEIVRHVVESGPEVIAKLESYGIQLTHEDGAGPLHLNREAGHSHRRIVHAADATGRAIQACLEHQLSGRANADIFEDHMAIDLIIRRDASGAGGRCVGVYALDRNRGRVDLFRARIVVLATGGASRAYLYTSNPPGATGDGIAMAWRAGCRIANMEFIQFHPTSLYLPGVDFGGRSFLITEAVRGDGGVLRNLGGERFMPGYDDREELAPRDIVARAIDDQMKRRGEPHVWLDISHKPAEEVTAHFPNIHETLLSHGIDMTSGPIPVVPAAHYTCGGVKVDEYARTSISGLLACGEVTCSGLHGANRLASNSLLEALVFAHRAIRPAVEYAKSSALEERIPAWDESGTHNTREWVLVQHNKQEVRRLMSDYVGIVRSTLRLERAERRVQLLYEETEDFYDRTRVSSALCELRNLIAVAHLIVASARRRKESRGLHFMADYPESDSAQVHDTLFEYGRNR